MYLQPMFAVGVLFALTACTGPQAEPVEQRAAPEVTVTATVTATTTATPPVAATEYGLADDNESVSAPIVADVEDLRLTLGAAGLICEGWRVIAEGTAGECDGGILLSAFPDTVLGQTAHRAGVALSFTAISTQDRADVALLVGPNWFLRADTTGAYTLRDLIGGSVVGITE